MSILGIDEVGRGPLAGPLVVGAVILPTNERPWFKDLKDSKKLTAKKREELNTIITREASTGLGWVSAKELDQIGISEALKLATKLAVKSIKQLHIPFNQIVIDGKVNFLSNTSLSQYVSTCVKADNKIREVSAASIIAKVARDRYMISLASDYPQYHFDKHVGYGTKAHLRAIYDHGLTPEHRKSFEPCKTLASFTHHNFTDNQPNTTIIGQKAEQAVANHLESRGHTIIARNHKTYFYEIDIISTNKDAIYFTEVKYRKNNLHGSGLNAITSDKQRRMAFAAESYLKYTATKYHHYNPLLAVAAVSGSSFNVDTWFPLDQS